MSFDHSWTPNAYDCASRRWDARFRAFNAPYANTPALEIPSMFLSQPEAQEELAALDILGRAEDRYHLTRIQSPVRSALTEQLAESLAYRLGGGICD